MSGPLSGITVVEWAMFINGPAAASMLGDLGAKVIKIEPPEVGDAGRGLVSMYGTSMSLPGGRVITFEGANRSKKSITVNLRKEKGKKVLHQLVGRADVFLTNFSEDVASKCGADWQTLSKINQRIIYAVTNGYGSKGPDSRKRAFDTVAQARSGLMLSIGDKDNFKPQLIPGAMMDQAAATMLVLGILAALIARNETGRGQRVESSMLGTALHLQALNVNTALWRKHPLGKHSREKPSNPLGNFYRCADGKWLLLAEPQSDRFWGEFCNIIGRLELEKDSRFDTMSKRRGNSELVSILDEVFVTKSRNQWLEILNREKCRFAYTAILSAEELAEDEQVLQNRYIVDWDHNVLGRVKTVAFPVDFSENPAEIQSEAPEFGQHTEEVLLEFGYSWEEIERLHNELVI